MKTMLLQPPKPFEDESLESYLIRIANKNGYQDFDRFLSALKHYLCDGDSERFSSFPTDIRRINPYSSKHSSAARSHALHQISQLTFTEPVDLLKLAINRSPLKYSPSVTALIRGCEVFPRSLLRTNIIPVCPVCLKENGYANYLWHFEGYDYPPLAGQLSLLKFNQFIASPSFLANCIFQFFRDSGYLMMFTSWRLGAFN